MALTNKAECSRVGMHRWSVDRWTGGRWTGGPVAPVIGGRRTGGTGGWWYLWMMHRCLNAYPIRVPISLQDLSYGGTHRGGKLPNGLSKRNAVTFLTYSSSIISDDLRARKFIQMPFDVAYQTLFII